MITPEFKKLAAQEMLDRREAKESLAKLYQRFYPQWQLGEFHHKVAGYLDKFVTGEIKRLIINIPPGHVKSMFSSMLMPASYVGHEPYGQFIGGSYNSDLAKKFGREVRNIVASHDYHTSFPNVWLRKDSKSAGRWNTNSGGSYISAAVRKPVTGQRANRLVIDDPHADFVAGNDRRQTDRDWEWFKSLYTRLMPGAGVALIMQRMSTHDMTQRFIELCEDKGDEYVHINFPAVLDDDKKPIRHDGTKSALRKIAEGNPLWPEFFTMKVLLDFAKTLGPSQFNAMYQQAPEELFGQIIKSHWKMHWTPFGRPREGAIELPRRLDGFDYIAQSWDMRFKKEKTGSFVVGQVWGFFGEYKALLDQVRGQWGFEESCKAIMSLSSKWPEATLRWIEDKANGHAIEDHLTKKLKLKLTPPVPGDKTARLRATENDWANLTVLLPPPDDEEYEWAQSLWSRLMIFPAEPNDEGDAISQAINTHNKKSQFWKSEN